MSQSSDKPLVLHLAVDYPNVYRPENTVAVRNFVKANENLDHLVIALTRAANPFAVARIDGDGKGDNRVVSMRYWGFPFGLLLALSMFIVALRVRAEVKRRGIAPVLIHAHKLTFEGLAGWWLARWLRIPLVLSIRGEAESKILRFKPHYHPLIQRILSDAARIYYVSAWFKPLLNQRFKVATDKQKLLPNFVAHLDAKPDVVARPDRLLTVLDLNVYRKKGLDRLLPAFKDCLVQFPQAHLDIIGRGSPAAVAEVAQLIEKLDLGSNVSMLGAMPNSELQARLPSYAGMALPSHNETFGMVYVEALLAGVPILHSRGTGIDGFVDFVEARVVVDPLDLSSISSGLSVLISQQIKFHEWLTKNRELIFNSFDRSYFAIEYLEYCRRLHD